jgi:hypothetical protein
MVSTSCKWKDLENGVGLFIMTDNNGFIQIQIVAKTTGTFQLTSGTLPAKGCSKVIAAAAVAHATMPIVASVHFC